MIKRFINVYNIDKEKRENERKAMNEHIYNLKNNDDNNNDNDIFLHMGITSNIYENNDDNLEKKNDFCCLSENKQNNKNDIQSDKKEIDKNIKVEEQLKKKANEQKGKMKKKKNFI